jgi:hypothetical protein
MLDCLLTGQIGTEPPRNRAESAFCGRGQRSHDDDHQPQQRAGTSAASAGDARLRFVGLYPYDREGPRSMKVIRCKPWVRPNRPITFFHGTRLAHTLLLAIRSLLHPR